MKIKNIKLSRANMRLTKPYTIAYKTVDEVENLLLELEMDNGIVGLGSSNISAYVTQQSNEDTWQDFQSGLLEGFIGKDIRDFPSFMENLCEQLKAQVGLCTMMDIALHDAIAQYHETPLVDFLGRHHHKMATSVTIGIMSVDQTLEEAKAYLDAGFKVLKVKLGAEVKEDLERIYALRKELGTVPIIRVDANQGWTLEDTKHFFLNATNLSVELVEQPLSTAQWEDIQQIPHAYLSKIAADESVTGPESAAEILSLSRVPGIINIKLMKCGGIHRAKQIAALAHSKRVDLMWGCNDESIISITAALHAAFSCPHTQYIDLDGSFDLAEDLVSGGFMLEDGYLTCTDLPGLGVKLLT